MGSAKKKRSHAPTVRDKNILNLYNKLHEIVSLLAELLHIQLMTDTTVLHLSTLGKLHSLILQTPPSSTSPHSVSSLLISSTRLSPCWRSYYTFSS
jgi:hypothetical protein